MEALGIIAIILGVLGIIGSIVPALPGPPLSWVGMLLAFFAKGTSDTSEPMSTALLLVFAGITVLVSILDYIVPAAITRASGGSKAASTGAVLGMIAGIFLTPIGMLTGSLLGAFLGEWIAADRSFGQSLKAALGSFAGFILGTGMKLIASGIMMYYIVVYSI